jgi:anti-sigma factor RsiW
MNPQDNPHFTAYALGELSAEEAREFHATLAATPAVAHELEQIEAVTDALRHGAPIPQPRLTHEQRHAVLHPANMPRRMQPMMPRKPVPRPQTFWPVVKVLLRSAALITLTGAAFLAGWSVRPEAHEQVADTRPNPPEETREQNQTTVVSAPVVAAKAPPVVKPEPVKVAETKPVKVAQAAPAKPQPTVAVVIAPAAKPVEAHSPNLGFIMPQGRGVFANTAKQSNDQFKLRPSLIKPATPKAKGEMFASPQLVKDSPEAKPARDPELYIHSWKAEMADCPWNPAHRLLRVVIQLPADQAAVMRPDAVFPVQISFDQTRVKQFRMLSERHLAATELRNAGTHVLWYEFQPNGGSEGVRDRQIASVTLPNAHFTSQTVGPFDSSKLQVIDRGFSLQNAREDFVFEASVVGFGLLMRGAEQTGVLNHELVLNLSKQAKGADTTGERARFVRLVQEAQRVAGL